MSANRIFYAIQSIAFSKPSLGSGFIEAHGVQSVGTTTTFNLEQVFELGQLNVYENTETVPDVSISVEKAIDGDPLIYHLATQNATNASLLGRTNKSCDVVLSIFDDDHENASGVPLHQAYISGLVIDNLSYAIPVQGFATETVDLVGNDKAWRSSSFLLQNTSTFNGSDEPAVGIQRREDVIMGTVTGSVFPTDIPNLTISNGSGFNAIVGNTHQVHFQDINISVSLNRNSLFGLGKKREFYKFAQFPTNVTCDINVLNAGLLPGDGVNANSNTDNLVDQPIVIKLVDGTVFNLGNNNKLSNVTMQGGSTGGEEMTTTYSYSNFNELRITQPNDPAGLS